LLTENAPAYPTFFSGTHLKSALHLLADIRLPPPLTRFGLTENYSLFH
jgi:hypothetical protein